MLRSSLATHRSVAFTLSTLLLLSACGGDDEPSDLEPGNTSSSQDMNTMDQGSSPDQGEDASPDEDMASSAEEMGLDMGVDMTSGGDDMAMVDMADMSGEEMMMLPERPWDVTARGPYNVGYTTTQFTYQVEPGATQRTIDVSIWHPSLQEQGAPARYLSGVVTSDGASMNMAIPDSPASFPVFVFSHGNASFPEQSYFMTEHFASHGWIVVAPRHTLNSYADQDNNTVFQRTIDRPQDIRNMLDWFEAGPDSHPLAARMNLEQVAMSGHSYGGYTTLAIAGAEVDVMEIEQSCMDGTTPQYYCALLTQENKALFAAGFRDPRVKAAIPVTPGFAGLYRGGTSAIDIPTLFITAKRDMTLPEASEGDPLWAPMVEGKGHMRLQLTNSGHFTPSNLCELTAFVPAANGDGCDATFTPEEEVQAIMNHYGLAFAQYHVLGLSMEEAAVVTGEATPYMDSVVTVEAR